MSAEPGPAARRLAEYVRGADPEHLSDAAASWHDVVIALNSTRAILRHCAQQVADNMSGSYADAAHAQFTRLADVTVERQREVRQAGRTLSASSQALAHAREVHRESQAEPGASFVAASGGYVLDPWGEEAVRRNQYRAQQDRHDARQFDDREQRATAETGYLDHVFTQTREHMNDVERVRGSETDDDGDYRVDPPTRRTVDPPRRRLPDDPGPQGHEPQGHHPPRTTPSATTPQPTGHGSPSGSFGDLSEPSSTGGVGSATAPSTGGGSLGIPTASLAVGVGGLGAGALAGGLRGGLSSAGVRGIGASGSTAGSGVLGRGSGTAGAGTGARAGGGAGSRGRGSGRAGARVGAGGRAGRRRDEDDRDQREVLDEDAEQWLEDDATGPEVMTAASSPRGDVPVEALSPGRRPGPGEPPPPPR